MKLPVVFLLLISVLQAAAIEMCEEDIILLKNVSDRAYSDAMYDHHSVGKIQVIEEEVDGISWKKRFFYATPSLPSSVGSVYYDQNSKSIIIAFHGSYWIIDWLKDFYAPQKAATDLSPSLLGRIHEGFSSLIADSYTDMMEKIQLSLGRDIQGNDKIYVTGHSLGGALAMLGGAMISSQHNLRKNSMKIVAFSTPRGVIGDAEFVQCVHKKIGIENILSFSTKGDVVPYLPQKLVSPIWKYAPLGINIEINPIEKGMHHYAQAVPRAIDEAAEHPLRPIGFGFAGYFAGRYAWLELGWKFFGFEVAGPVLLTKEYFITCHALPPDEIIKGAFRYTASNYRNTSMAADEIGNFSLIWSVQRGVLKRLYNNLS